MPFDDRPEGVGFANPDVVALSAAFGGRGVVARGAAAVESEITAAVKRGGLSVNSSPDRWSAHRTFCPSSPAPSA